MLNSVIDLSHFQAPSSFAKVYAAGVRAVIHKATQNDDYTDNTFHARQKACRAAGLMFGAYHFGSSASDATAQAKRFVDIVQPDERTLLALDFEDDTTTGKTMTLEGARHFVTAIYNETGRFPVFYTYSAFINARLGKTKDPILAHCPLWIAHYTTKTDPVIQATWPTWTLWQYTDGHAGLGPYAVDGVGDCDRDKFNGDENGLRRLFGYPPSATK